MNNTQPDKKLRDVGWNQLDLPKFFAVSVLPSVILRTFTYPTWVIKTALQIQEKQIYTGVFDAVGKIFRNEGPRAFYKGFLFTTVGNIPSQLMYISILEFVREKFPVSHLPPEINHDVVSFFVAGGCASFISNTMTVPVDIVTQRLMVQNNQFHHAQYKKYSGGLHALADIWRVEGLRGLFRGYGATFFLIGPSSAVWWGTYATVKNGILHYFPQYNEDPRPIRAFSDIKLSELIINGICGSMAGGVAALVTNPLDVAKTRLQVLQKEQAAGQNSLLVIANLVKEEGWKSLWRGVALRMATMSVTSFFMINMYNHMKGWSIKADY